MAKAKGKTKIVVANPKMDKEKRKPKGKMITDNFEKAIVGASNRAKKKRSK